MYIGLHIFLHKNSNKKHYTSGRGFRIISYYFDRRTFLFFFFSTRKLYILIDQLTMIYECHNINNNNIVSILEHSTETPEDPIGAPPNIPE